MRSSRGAAAARILVRLAYELDDLRGPEGQPHLASHNPLYGFENSSLSNQGGAPRLPLTRP